MSYETFFKSKRVLVTGGSRGIGKAISQALLKYGANVTVLGKNPQNLESLKKESPTISTICVDIIDWVKVQEALATKTFDLLVNNAGISVTSTFLETTPEAFDLLLGTNLKSIFCVSQIVVKNMIKDNVKSGVIVNISSLSSARVFPYSCLYSSGKAATDMLTKVMAVELGKPHNIRTNSVAPAGVYTDMLKDKAKYFEKSEIDQAEYFKGLVNRTPLVGSCGGGPVVSVDEVVDSVLFLLSDNSKAITGQSIVIDNGYMAS